MTLTETAQYTKKIMVYVAIGFVVIISLWIGIKYYIDTRPVIEVKEQPTKLFGVLPKPPLPKTKLTAKNVTYNLDTETGSLPEGFPELMKVYFIPKLGTTYLAPDKAKSSLHHLILKMDLKLPRPPSIVLQIQKGENLFLTLIPQTSVLHVQ